MLTCGSVAVLALIILFLLPDYFKSTSTFYSASPDLAVPEAIYGTGATSLRYYGTDEDTDRILSIAKSDQLMGFLIDSFNLYEHYEIDTSHQLAEFKVKEELEGLYNVKRTKENAVEISIEDEEKELAAKMVNAARIKINEIGQRLIKESQQKVLETYNQNLEDREQELSELSDSLRDVRQKYGIFNTITQGEVLASLVVKSEARLQANQVKLDVLRNSARAPKDTIAVVNAMVKSYEKEVEYINEKLDLFNEGLAKAEVLGRTNKEATEQLSEDKERYKQFLSAYESDFPAILLLEAGGIPVKKSRPVRSLILLVTLIVTFIFCVIGVLIHDLYKEVDWNAIMAGEEETEKKVNKK